MELQNENQNLKGRNRAKQERENTADKIRSEVSVPVLYREALCLKLNDVPPNSISDANFIWGRSNKGEQINC